MKKYINLCLLTIGIILTIVLCDFGITFALDDLQAGWFITLLLVVAGVFYCIWTHRIELLVSLLIIEVLVPRIPPSFYLLPVTMTPTDSLPRYAIYRYKRKPLSRCVIVQFPQPRNPGVRNITSGVELMKYIAAMPGDVVFISQEAIFVDDHHWPNSQPPDHPNPHDHRLLGQHVIRPGYVWALGTNTDSFDSKFFGEVPISSITNTVEPLYGASAKTLCNDTGSSPNPCFLRHDSVLCK